MKFSLKYAKEKLTFTIPDGIQVDVMETTEVPVIEDVEKALLEALDAPMNAARLEDRPAPASVAVAVPDETRPTPLKTLLPPLLGRIFAAYPGLKPEQVSIVVGGGLHPAPDEAQLSRILPEDIRGCRVVSHDAINSPMTDFGTTSRGTPVQVNAAFGEAELKIVIGQIDPHQFVGFTGGSKGVTIGCASKDMIEKNHSMMSSPEAHVGSVENNPVRLDLHESGEIIGIDLAVNVVLNASKQIVALLAGRPRDIMMEGCKTTAKVYGRRIDHDYDIAIASCGGTPKDICLYQSQKGLNQASQCLRTDGQGKVLLLAACSQGVGDDHYLEYVRQFPCAHAQLKEFKEKGFRMGAHKSFMFSRTITNYDVCVVSEMDDAALAECHLKKAPLQETIDRWIEEIGPGARIAIIPNANTTYFFRGGE